MGGGQLTWAAVSQPPARPLCPVHPGQARAAAEASGEDDPRHGAGRRPQRDHHDPGRGAQQDGQAVSHPDRLPPQADGAAAQDQRRPQGGGARDEEGDVTRRGTRRGRPVRGLASTCPPCTRPACVPSLSGRRHRPGLSSGCCPCPHLGCDFTPSFAARFSGGPPLPHSNHQRLFSCPPFGGCRQSRCVGLFFETEK